LLTFDQIVEAIGELSPQERLKLRQWLNRNAADEALNQGVASNGGAQNTSDIDMIPPIVMRRVPPIAPEKNVKTEMNWLRESGLIDAATYKKAVEDFNDYMSVILPPPRGDVALLLRAEEISKGYSSMSFCGKELRQ
jgi:hypothetical protein